MHALTRETFGEKLVSHQIIRSKIGLMSTRIAAMHAWLESLIFSLKESPRIPLCHRPYLWPRFKALSYSNFVYEKHNKYLEERDTSEGLERGVEWSKSVEMRE
jgi:alkylation response protein AidB-like acyl-CoA dehydrogenase